MLFFLWKKVKKNFQNFEKNENFEKKESIFQLRKRKKENSTNAKKRKCRTRNHKETTFFFFEIFERRAKENRDNDLRHLARTRALSIQPM